MKAGEEGSLGEDHLPTVEEKWSKHKGKEIREMGRRMQGAPTADRQLGPSMPKAGCI